MRPSVFRTAPPAGIEISRQSTQQILQQVMALGAQERVMILAPIVRGRKGEYKKELEKLARQGFVRARVDGVLRSLDEEITLDKRKNHTIEVVVDRLLIKPEVEKRLEASIETATKLAGRTGAGGGGGWGGAAVFAEAGVPGMRRERAATGAAVVFVQQSVWRVRDVHGAGQPLELRSGEGDCRSVAAAARRRAGARRHIQFHGARVDGALAARLKIPIQKAVRGAAEEGAGSPERGRGRASGSSICEDEKTRRGIPRLAIATTCRPRRARIARASG